jgi:hypothetical protein
MCFGHGMDTGAATATLLRERGARLDVFAAAALGDLAYLASADLSAPCPDGCFTWPPTAATSRPRARCSTPARRWTSAR